MTMIRNHFSISPYACKTPSLFKGLFKTLGTWDRLQPMLIPFQKIGLNEFQPYIAFFGHFGQYIEVRESSPEISKRFNPKVFLRIAQKEHHYLDLEYAHESNGQRIAPSKDTMHWQTS